MGEGGGGGGGGGEGGRGGGGDGGEGRGGKGRGGRGGDGGEGRGGKGREGRQREGRGGGMLPNSLRGLGAHEKCIIIVHIITDIVVSTNDSKSVFGAIDTFLTTFKEDKPILLVEMGGMARFKSENEITMVELFGFFPDAQVVVSLSSGGANFISNIGIANFKKVMRTIKNSLKTIDFYPFKEAEAELFMKEYVPSVLDRNEFKRLTNYNPSLMFACHDCRSIKDARSVMNSATRDYVEEMRMSLESDNFTWIQQSLPQSMEMLHYAANCEMIPQLKLFDYQATWLCAENITYIADSTPDEFELVINFPEIYKVLMNMLWKNRNHSSLKYHNSIIYDYQFEEIICEKIKRLTFLYSKQRVPGVHSESVEISCNVKMEANQPVTTLSPTILYHLRPCHPVIDAVLYTESTEKALLLLIQVSISTYKGHKNSKAGDLMHTVTGCEHNKSISNRNWLDYYCDCVPSTCNKDKLECIYLYLSPKQLHGVGDENPDKTMGEDGVGNRPRTLSFFLGLIQDQTSCAEFIKNEHTMMLAE